MIDGRTLMYIGLVPWIKQWCLSIKMCLIQWKLWMFCPFSPPMYPRSIPEKTVLVSLTHPGKLLVQMSLLCDATHLLKLSTTLSYNVMFMSTSSEFFILIAVHVPSPRGNVLSRTLTRFRLCATATGETCASALPPSDLIPSAALSLPILGEEKSHLDLHLCFC